MAGLELVELIQGAANRSVYSGANRQEHPMPWGTWFH